jgi:hypothetical protein
MTASQLPIRVSPHVTESGKRGWRWTCSDHPRHRGHHQLERWTDWVRANRDDPDDHAFVRCMRGASYHWHKLHAPEHHCCPIAYQEKAKTMSKKDHRNAQEKADWKAGEFTEEDAAGTDTSAEELNRQRAEGERQAGNPLAPPEGS